MSEQCRTDMLSSPLEQEIGVDAALHRDRRDESAGNQTLRDHVVLERPVVQPTGPRRVS
jgi:hypothetical protein